MNRSGQGSLKEITRLRGVEPPERLELSGGLTLREYALMFAGKPIEERVYTDEHGITRSRFWHPPEVEGDGGQRDNGGPKPRMLPPGHPARD